MVGIKNFLGYDRLFVEFNKEEIVFNAHSVSGIIEIHSKINSEIESIEIELWEYYQKGWWKYKESEKLRLGRKEYKKNIPLKNGQLFRLKYNLIFDKIESSIDIRRQTNTVLRPLIDGIKILANVYSNYELIAKIKLKKSPLKAIAKVKLEHLKEI